MTYPASGFVGEADHVEHAVGALADEGIRHAVDAGKEPEILADVEDAVPARLAPGDRVNPRTQVMLLRGDVEPIDRRPAGSRGEERGQDLDERGFPGPVRPEKPKQLSGSDLQIDAIERGELGRRVVRLPPEPHAPAFAAIGASQVFCANGEV